MNYLIFFVEDYAACEEIKEALEKLKKELRTFVYYFDDLLTTFFFFFFFVCPRSLHNLL